MLFRIVSESLGLPRRSEHVLLNVPQLWRRPWRRTGFWFRTGTFQMGARWLDGTCRWLALVGCSSGIWAEHCGPSCCRGNTDSKRARESSIATARKLIKSAKFDDSQHSAFWCLLDGPARLVRRPGLRWANWRQRIHPPVCSRRCGWCG